MSGLRWKIGEVELSQIVEIDAGEIIQSVISEATPENISKIKWLTPSFADSNGKLKALVQGFLIRSDGKNILVDTGIGANKIRVDVPEWNNIASPFLKKLYEIVVREEDIDLVICTHLHMDHVGWNTKLVDGIWVPTFPRAKYLFCRNEFEYWKSKPSKEIQDDHAAFEDSVMPVVNAELSELIGENDRIDKNIRVIPTPGHTPHHVSVVIESEGQRAIITGDFLHHPCQIARPEWSPPSDSDPEQSRETRGKALVEIADSETILIGSHFSETVAGYVKRRDKGFVFEEFAEET